MFHNFLLTFFNLGVIIGLGDNMKVEIVATTSERIKEAMQKKKITQAELSRLTGIDKSSISLYLSGKYSPKGDKLYKLSIALGVSTAWLAGFNAPMKEDKKTEPTVKDDKLTESQRQLMEFAKTVPEDKIDLILKVMRSIVEDD